METRLANLTILGLDSKATEEEIRQAHISAHPDKGGDKDKFQEIHRAYKELIQEQPESKSEKANAIAYQYFQKNDPQLGVNVRLFFKTFRKGLKKLTKEEQTKYVLDNKAKFQEAISIHNQCDTAIDYLIEIFVASEKLDLFKLLDATWAKNLMDFKNPDTISRFLSSIERVKDDWRLFVENYFGRYWLKDLCLSSWMLSKFVGVVPTVDKFSTERGWNMDAFFDYLGRDWLREIWYHDNPQQLAGFFSHNNYRRDIILNYLNGADEWLKKTIVDGKSIGIILKSLHEFNQAIHVFATEPSLDVIPRINDWDMFLRYIHVGFKNLIDDPVQLNAILTYLAHPPYQEEEQNNVKYYLTSTVNVVLFIKQYLPHKFAVCNLDQLTKAFDLICEANYSSFAHAVVKNLGIVRSMSNQHCYVNLFFDTSGQLLQLKQLLAIVDLNKNKSCYKALILAVAKGYYYQREISPLEGSWCGYSKAEKLAAAKELINSILGNQPIDAEKKKKYPAICNGELGQITAAYEGNPGIFGALRYFLLGGAATGGQASELQLTQATAGQLTYVIPTGKGP